MNFLLAKIILTALGIVLLACLIAYVATHGPDAKGHRLFHG